MLPRLFANRRLFILLLSVILLLVTMGMTRGDREQLSLPETGVKNAAAWVQGFFSRPVQAAAGWFDGSSNQLQAHNQQNVIQLKAQVAKLKQENKQLKKTLDYTKDQKVDTITARVVARSPDLWNNRVVINQGSKDGIRKDMPVVTYEGLIGRVKAVTGHMADVQLLTDTGSGPGIAAHVQTEDKEVFGLIEGYDTKTKRLLMKKIPSNAKLKKGQLVVTSGLSDIYTGDLLIGTVDKITSGEFGVDQMVYVKPAARFEQLQYVMVVRDPVKLKLKEHRKEIDSQGKGGE
ncbi:cell shape-determining protein MreC [Marinithermofilum abyssi]|uniref:Cell shape-determining protein MreC n=1 Tax=Marinithermofilum abyssi TaxID=1571185 RepID=A0A8J2Y9A8_9BACL|nr:rod shape-determining protein MreC [Marinithermofilum abyssi]GGE18570.1 cell shape-determining protein MreC [Marinithermofilum abyssi]